MSESFIAGGAKVGSSGKTYHVEKGRYYCTVKNAKDTVSKGAKTNGKRMIELEVRVLASETARISDGPEFKSWLIFSGTTIQTVENFLEASGAHPGVGGDLGKFYADDVISLNFWADLGVRSFKTASGGDAVGNEIKWFVFENLPEVPAEDDIPF